MICTHYSGGPGSRCRSNASVWILAPDGKRVPGAWVCLPHGKATHDEYKEKLGEEWPLQPVDENGDPQPKKGA